MGFLTSADPPRGEIMVWSSANAKAYFKADPIQTDGWVSTQDVGEIQPNGALKVLGAMGDMFKLSEGEFISPLKLENIFIQSEFVHQAFVWGEEGKEYVVAILVLDQAYLDKRKGLFARKRMFLLTEGPHLYYVDAGAGVRKGEVLWDRNSQPECKNFKIFFLHTV